MFFPVEEYSMTDSIPATTAVVIPVTAADFPLLIGKEQLGVSFQVRPEDAPEHFYERAHGADAGERGRQAGNGELYEAYKNVLFMAETIALLGMKPVDVYVKYKETPKGQRAVVYFWFAPGADHRNFQDPEFLEYTLGEFKRLASNVYVTGESYTNPHGPACIALKGIASCSARTELSLVEGVLEGVADEANTLLGIAMLGNMLP